MRTHEDGPLAARADELPRTSGPLDLAGLFERYGQEVYRLCLGMLGDPHEAEDGAQEVFLRAHRSWKSYDPRLSAPRTWLGQIAMNYCRSALRRRRVGQLALRLLGAAAGDQASAFSTQELRSDLGAALGLLDERHRSVILLRYYLEFSCAEIAELLQISEGTVHSRLYTARRRIMAALERESRQ
jgi:RNA polymerase sigma-70 factor (ECF subfamily)